MALWLIGPLPEEDLSIIVSLAFWVWPEREGLSQYLLRFFHALL